MDRVYSPPFPGVASHSRERTSDTCSLTLVVDEAQEGEKTEEWL